MACVKVYSYWMAGNYHDGHGMFSCKGFFLIMNPHGGEKFFPRKNTQGISAILTGNEKYLSLGNLNAKRDWGFSLEYVKCMWRILQQEKHDDYVIGTWEIHSVQEFVNAAFVYTGLEAE